MRRRVRRRLIGATLTVLGLSAVAFAPAWGVTGCASCMEGSHNPFCGCHTVINGFAVPINWPAGWERLFLPMLIIGVALDVTGIVLMIRARRFRGSPNTAR